ncbi:hypothetical protein ACF068_06600 [Streptomyces sp. NPDC016309]|uniref:hypothetical protein n=1 Tax=Streptomyces sp. NPDC016309 TaxID=3364965 RepID=UPI0036FA29D4
MGERGEFRPLVVGMLVAASLAGCSAPDDVRPPAPEGRTCPAVPAEAGWCFDERLYEEYPPKGDIDIVFGILSEYRVGEPVDLRLRVTNRTPATCRYEFEVESKGFADGEPAGFTVVVPYEVPPSATRELVRRTPVVKDPHPLFEVDDVYRRCRP